MFANLGPLSIDHFIPWGFVLHDEAWNLVPMFRNSHQEIVSGLVRGEILRLRRFAAPLRMTRRGASRCAGMTRRGASRCAGMIRA